ncbi:MAG: hypothetical protein CMF50_07305 [Legionellales bacterium]|nr:hypothetical protein [Legionellales bacterium]|tara:strand:- start:60414 stop:61907 length:1494 start_codon:yes stop_codon:yes gene_type:complete
MIPNDRQVVPATATQSAQSAQAAEKVKRENQTMVSQGAFWLKMGYGAYRAVTALTPSKMAQEAYNVVAIPLAEKTGSKALVKAAELGGHAIGFCACPITFVATHGIQFGAKYSYGMAKEYVPDEYKKEQWFRELNDAVEQVAIPLGSSYAGGAAKDHLESNYGITASVTFGSASDKPYGQVPEQLKDWVSQKAAPPPSPPPLPGKSTAGMWDRVRSDVPNGSADNISRFFYHKPQDTEGSGATSSKATSDTPPKTSSAGQSTDRTTAGNEQAGVQRREVGSRSEPSTCDQLKDGLKNCVGAGVDEAIKNPLTEQKINEQFDQIYANSADSLFYAVMSEPEIYKEVQEEFVGKFSWSEAIQLYRNRLVDISLQRCFWDKVPNVGQLATLEGSEAFKSKFEYCNLMKKRGTWPTSLEEMAIADMVKRRLVIEVIGDKDKTALKVTLNTKGERVIRTEVFNSDCEKEIFLQLKNGYYSLQEKSTPRPIHEDQYQPARNRR